MFNKITLDNGVRIVYENIPYIRSASFGIWVENGSRNEPAELSGISHFIEHMVFKGTENRSAHQLAKEMDAIGGQTNAFTTKESTCFYFKALDIHLKEGINILCDMFFNSRFDPKDTELERGVILEEIDMYEDAPEDLVVEMMFSEAFKGTPLARPILGTKETVKSITPEQIRRYMKENYDPKKTVVSLCGSFSDSDIELIKEHFSKMEPVAVPNIPEPAKYTPSEIKRKKKLEQNHIVISFPGLSFTDERRYALQVINSAIGGSMSSRMFQEIREKRGLCYSIYSFLTSHADTGLFSVYTAVKSDAQNEVIKLVKEEIKRFVDKGIDEEEFRRTIEQLKTNVLMSWENTTSRMNHLARSEYLFGEIKTADEIAALYDNVTPEAVKSVGETVFDFSKMSVSALGK